MEFIVTGRAISRTDMKSGVSQTSGKSWAAIDYVVEEVNAQYPKKMCFTIFGEERVNAALKNLHSNDIITVYCNIDASEYQGKFYNRVQAWKIEKNGTDIFTLNSNSPAPQPQVSTTAAAPPEVTPSATAPQSALKEKVQTGSQTTSTEDDLPF